MKKTEKWAILPGTEHLEKNVLFVYHNGELVDRIVKTSWENTSYLAKTHRLYGKTIIEVKKQLRGLDHITKPEEDEPCYRKGVGPKLLTVDPYAEFYPTPAKLAGRMFAKVDWKRVTSIMEPCAGKADLLEHLKRMVTQRQYRDRSEFHYNLINHFEDSCDCVEIDENLRGILKSKGYRVVGDDYLSFSTPKRSDLYLINPPFSSGVQFLEKAVNEISSVNGGQVVCILNAETIRNPYTYERKALIKRLSALDASIEYVKDAFRDAERKTGVEVAIVYVSIASSVRESEIFKQFQKAKEETHYEYEGAKAIVGGDWKERMVANYDMEARVGMALIDEYRAVTPYIMNGNGKYSAPIIELKVNGHDLSKTSYTEYLEALRYKYWDKFFSQPEITGRLTGRMSDEYSRKIDQMKCYDFNKFNINLLLEEIYSHLTESLEETIEWLFNELSEKHSWYPECESSIHYYTGWAHNKAHMIAYDKVILPIDGYSAYSSKTELDLYRLARTISDLEKALDFLQAGRPIFGLSPEAAITQANNRCDKTADFKYFTGTFYKKGTCHLKWKEYAIDLVKRLNIYVGRKRAWLPPCYGKKHYSEMTPEEKEVIDSFQGEASYEEVMRNPGRYIISDNEIRRLALPDAS